MKALIIAHIAVLIIVGYSLIGNFFVIQANHNAATAQAIETATR